MANPSARRPPIDLIQQKQQSQQHQQQQVVAPCRQLQENCLRQKNGPLPSAVPTAASSKGSPAAHRPNAVDLAVRPHYRGHQRRQSVARLLPDISKLRLLSWLVEASNELINCDIAIMDGVYAKLNRSRESLLFWQQSQQHQQHQVAGVISRAPPPPPAVQPVANKTVISKRQEQANKNSPATSQKQPRRKLFEQKASTSNATRSHHSLPLTNYDASSLAAISMRSSQSTTNRTTSDADSLQSQPAALATTPQSAADSIAASFKLMMRQQNLQQSGGQPMTARNNTCSLPIRVSAGGASATPALSACPTIPAVDESADFCDDTSNQSDDEDDDNSSAASSTTSSGIHGASSSASSASSSISSSVESSCSLEEPTSEVAAARNLATRATPPNNPPAEEQTANATATVAVSSAEQLSERIRRAVMEHNYLQNLLVNVIRQHDRQKECLEQELLATSRQPASLDAYGRRSASLDELPRIDLAGIADALDDGCQCHCHHSQPLRYAPAAAEGRPDTPLGASNKIGSRASTLPTSSSLSLFQPASLVPTRKNRRKKHSEPTREDLIQRLADKLCENCFETHYWLQSCTAIETPSEQAAAFDRGALDANASDSHEHPAAVDGASPAKATSGPVASKAPGVNRDSIIALRNATFIRLVQQQVRATISNSIELIDLIRKEIKSPESIKQKQLMRCFSASIQLLSSVASYVVPSQDISTFITAEMVPNGANGGLGVKGNKFSPIGTNSGSAGQQQTPATLFNLPPSDFDHILYPHPHHHQQHSAAGLGEAFLSNHQRPYNAASQLSQQQQVNNYHLAQAPEIPIRRRHNQPQQYRQRRSLDEVCAQDRLQQHPRVHLLSQDEQSANGSFRSLPPGINSPGGLSVLEKDESESVRSDSLAVIGSTSVDFAAANTNPTGVVESSSGASSNNSSASSSIARSRVQQSSLRTQYNPSGVLDGKSASLDYASPRFETSSNLMHRQQQMRQNPQPSAFVNDDFALFQSGRAKFWQSSKFNFIKKLLQVKQQRLLRQQSKDRRIYNNKVANKFRLVMMDLIHFNKSQQLLTTENGVNSLLTSMRNVLEFGLYLTVKLY